jgi:hypothetical protein
MSADVDSMRFYGFEKKFKKNFTSKCRAVVLISSRRHNARSAINKYIHTMTTFSKKTNAAISKYGKEFCIWAAQENKAGNGANTISWSFPRESGLQGRTRSADSAIDAGYEILKG